MNVHNDKLKKSKQFIINFDIYIWISLTRFYVGENISYTLELEINADKGVVITKKMNGGNFSEANAFRKSDTMSNTEQQRYQFSFKNSMEFRCITQQYLDILKREEEKLLCTRTGKHVYK